MNIAEYIRASKEKPEKSIYAHFTELKDYKIWLGITELLKEYVDNNLIDYKSIKFGQLNNLFVYAQHHLKNNLDKGIFLYFDLEGE